MKRVKSYVNKEQRIIVLNSSIINNNEYKNLKEVLEKHQAIYESTLEQDEKINNRTKDILRHSFIEIYHIARSEWRAINKQESGNTNCSLCNQPNKLIFFIENKFNESQLNVGSTCIDHFKGVIENKMTDESFETLKNRLLRENREIDRKTEFRKEYPTLDAMLRKYNNIAENSSLLLPMSLYRFIIDCISAIHDFRTKYFKGKIPKAKLKDLHLTIQKIDTFIEDTIDPWISENQSNDFVVTLDDKKWLEMNKKDNIVVYLRENQSLISEDTIEHFGYQSFLKKHIVVIRNSLAGVRKLSLSQWGAIVTLNNSNYGNIRFSASFSEIIKNFGCSIFDSNEKYGFDDCIKIFRFHNIIDNVYVLVYSLDKLFNGYEFYYSENIDRITIISKLRNSYCEYNNSETLFEYIGKYMRDYNTINNAEHFFFERLRWKLITYEYKEDYLNDMKKDKEKYS